MAVGDERGSALVEAAFVVPLLCLLIAGMVDLGMILDQRSSVHSQIHRVGRAAAVGTLAAEVGCEPNTGSDGVDTVVCALRSGQTPAPAVKIVVPDPYQAGETLTMCTITPVVSTTGLSGAVTDGATIQVSHSVLIQQRIETLTSFEEPAPAGTDWSFCG